METRAVCVLFLLISRKFKTLYFLAIVATWKLSAMGAVLESLTQEYANVGENEKHVCNISC
jgi:hypothetical protein